MSRAAKARAVAGEVIPPAPATEADQRRQFEADMAALRRDLAETSEALERAQVDLADANRLLAEVKAQRNAAMDDVMLLRAQLKVAVEDGAAGWALAKGGPAAA